MTQPAKSQEPSMEEILASIRRIIADDDASKSEQRPAEAPKTVAAPAAPAGRPAPPRPPAPAPRVMPPAPSLTGVEAASTVGSADPGPTGEAAAEDQSSDILDLTESMASPMPQSPSASPMPGPTPQFRTIDGNFDVSYEDAAGKSAPQRNIGEARHPSASNGSEHRGDERAPLISSATSAAVDSAFNTLAQTVLVHNARTLEDLVREMLRPMLKSWLDDNLPAMVERLVRAEIERVSRGRMS
jgi:cell pole-organizing protein PopZ